MQNKSNIVDQSQPKIVWNRLPVVLRAVIIGVLVTAIGTLPWAWLVAMNIKHLPSIPWSVPPTIIYLWLYWKYFITGKGWPRSTASARITTGRGNSISGDVWGPAILAGIFGLTSLLIFSSLLGRMIKLPQQDASGVEHVPIVSLFFMLLASSAVAGITEETGFRGYMQKPIEERHGPVVAILITGIMFGLLHFSHAETTLALMPFYFFVAAVYGMLAYITNSILPGMVLHAAGDVFAGLNLFTSGQSEWETSTKPRPLIWESGIDGSFLLSLLAFLVIGAITVWAYVALRKAVIKEKVSQ
jgi:membrane protease YdiL (CAAX protease family)